MQADNAKSQGHGQVISKTFAPGGTVSGKGRVIRKSGEVVEFILTSEPLTQAQADELNKKEDIPCQ